MKIKNHLTTAPNPGTTVMMEGLEGSKIIGQAEQQLQKKVKVAGFRRGTAPPSQCRAVINPAQILRLAHQIALPQAFQFARQHIKNLPARPQITVEKLNFQAYWLALRWSTTSTAGGKLKKYQNLTVPMTKTVTISDAEVVAEWELLQKKYGTLATVHRTAQLGDVVTIDYVGWLHNQKVKYSETKNFQVELGSHQTLADFETQLVGVKTGQLVLIKVQMPADHFNAKLQNQLLTLKVQVKRIASYTLPSPQQLLTKLSLPTDVKTIVQLKAHIKQQLLVKKRHAHKLSFIAKLVDIIAQDSQLSPSVPALREQLLKLKQHFANKLQQQRLSLRTYQQKTGVSAAVINAELTQTARSLLLQSMILDEVSEREGIKPTPAQITAALDRGPSVKKPVSLKLKQNVIAQLTQQLTIDFLFEHNDGTFTIAPAIKK